MQVKDSGSDKVVVFAQWNAYLDIIQYFLVQAGYNFTRCEYISPPFIPATHYGILDDGSMTSKERERSLATLRDDEDCNIGLFSTKAGGVGELLAAGIGLGPLLIDVERFGLGHCQPRCSHGH